MKTDHNNLRFLLEEQSLEERQQKWVSKLQAYDFEIGYVKGKHNVVTDALSRRPAALSLMDVTQDWKAQLLVEYSKDRQACDILDGMHRDDQFWVMGDVIYYKDRIYLVPCSQLKERIMQVAHDSPLIGHPGFLKTYRVVRERFSLQGLKGDVLKHVRECVDFQRNKVELSHPVDLLQPLPIPERKWESISMDFITGLPAAQGQDCIYVVVDRLTKFAHSLLFH